MNYLADNNGRLIDKKYGYHFGPHPGEHIHHYGAELYHADGHVISFP